MFGRRKNSMTTDEPSQQSAMILDSLEVVEEEGEYDDTMTREEDLIADLFSDSSVAEEEESSYDESYDEAQEEEYEEPVEEAKPKKRGFFGFFRRSRKKDIQLYDEAEEEESYESDYDQDYESESAESGEETFDSVGLEEAADQEPEGFNLFETEEPNPSVTEEAVLEEADAEEADVEETVIEDDSLKEADQSPFLFGGDSEEAGINPDAAETGWMTEDEDLVLNPALFALADEMGDPDETEALEESPDGYRTGDETVEAYDDEDESLTDESDDEEAESEEDSDESEEEYDEEENYYLDDDKGSKKKYIIIAAIAALALGLSAFFIIRNMRKAPEGKAYVQTVQEIMGLNLGSTHTNRYSGIVEAQKQTKINLEEGMTVARCYVNVGDDVKKGDRLFKYDTEALNLQAQKKQLEIDQTNQKINSATKKKAEYDRDTKTKKGVELLDAQQGSAEQELNIETYKLDLQAKKKELNAINKNIKNSVVKSKTNGQVLKINNAIGKGQTEESEMESSNENNGDRSYMVIVAKGDYQVKFKVNETNMQGGDKIGKGKKVIVRSRISNATWEGTIKSLRTDQKADEEETTSEDDIFSDTGNDQETDTKYPGIIVLQSSKGLMLGQHVLVELAGEGSSSNAGKKNSQIRIPKSHVLEEGGKYYVFADNGSGKLIKKAIKIGDYDEAAQEYVVKGGLSLDDKIADITNCREGMATTTNQDEAVNKESDEEDIDGDEGGEESTELEMVDGLEIDE